MINLIKQLFQKPYFIEFLFYNPHASLCESSDKGGISMTNNRIVGTNAALSKTTFDMREIKDYYSTTIEVLGHHHEVVVCFNHEKEKFVLLTTIEDFEYHFQKAHRLQVFKGYNLSQQNEAQRFLKFNRS